MNFGVIFAVFFGLEEWKVYTGVFNTPVCMQWVIAVNMIPTNDYCGIY
jgi:hypothetical protein